MLKMLGVGFVSVLLGVSSQPLAREQATPTPPPPSLSAPATAPVPTDVQQLPWTGRYFVETVPATPPAQTDQTTAEQAAKDAAARALNDLRSRRECTFALKMKEVDPDFDSKIRIESAKGGDAKIRRIQLPACANFQVHHESIRSGALGIIREKKQEPSDSKR